MCIYPKTIQNKFYDPKKFKLGEKYRKKYYEIPCGKCINCLSQKANELSQKMKYNYYYKYDMRGIFITLTYATEQVPLLYVEDKDLMYDTSTIEINGKEYQRYDENGKVLRLDNFGNPVETLQRKDYMLFMKKFRKEIYERGIYDKPLCFVACSEYGDKGERPHYHAVILGIGASEEVKQIIRKCWRNEKGQIGLIDVKSLENPRGIAYVCKYTMKQLEWTNNDLREKPKVWHSIGLDKAIIEHEGIEKLKNNNWQIQFGQNKLNKTSFGNYYIKKWHGKKNTTQILREMTEQLEQLHIPKQAPGTPYCINGYTIKQIKEHCKEIAKQQETSRKNKLEMKGQKFPRRRNEQIYDMENEVRLALEIAEKK